MIMLAIVEEKAGKHDDAIIWVKMAEVQCTLSRFSFCIHFKVLKPTPDQSMACMQLAMIFEEGQVKFIYFFLPLML